MKKIILTAAFLAAAFPAAFAETAIKITIGNETLSGTLNDTPAAAEFIKMLPLEVSMSNYGGREIYGGIPKRITAVQDLKTNFEDGEITYCPQNNTVAIFYSQTDRPNLGMEVMKIGAVTSDLAVFKNMGSRVNAHFEILKQDDAK